ncbi:MAG TPA: RNA-binding S4 domain-containing protein [Stellaceae bacterium]|nr:RNA-binding S4 domain-containing protein [Stellaceae bacterium]
MSEAGPSIRIDKWLWFARMAKTRSLAARLCEGGRVSIGGAAVLKPHHPVRVGDSISVMQGRARRGLVVRELGQRRGPAEEARRLYDEPTPPVPIAATEPPWTPILDEENWA